MPTHAENADDLREFWRSIVIQNDAVWARLLDGPPGVMARLQGAKIRTVGTLLHATPEQLEKALPGLTPEALQEIRVNARAWLGQAETETEPAQGVNDGGDSGAGDGVTDSGTT